MMRCAHSVAPVLALALAMAVIAACEQEAEPAQAPAVRPVAQSTADWSGIVERGTIRLARRSWDGFDTLPSQGLSTEQYRRLAERFAARHGLKAEWVIAADMAEIFAVIEQGRADIAVHNTTVLPSRQQRVAFSLPLTRSREWVIGTAADGTFGVAAQTAYVESLAAHYPDAQRVPVSADADPLAFQAMLEQGVIQATIMDEAAARVVVRTSSTVKKLRELPAVHEHAWVMRKGNPVLKQVLDDYLRERHTVDESIVEHRDWRAIRNAGRLRMLTVNGPTTYYLWRGELLGFEYELVTLFAEANDLELEVIVAGDPAELVDHLLSGRGDIIAAGLTPTPEREALGARFSRPYMEIRETFVTARQPITELADLAGRSVAVNPTTSYAATLRALAAPAPFDIRYVEQPTPTILAGVADGTYDATLADSQRAQLAATFDDQLSLGLALEPARGLAWAVREGNDELLARLDAFIAERYRGYEFNVLRNKYFVNERRMSRQREHRVTGEVLSPYDDIVRPLAETTAFDWRLIVAQMYQESGFDPERVSFAGARGLLQVLPSTAREVGADPARLQDPEIGIAAGIDYLAWTRERFPNLPVGEQLWFALAAYNAGPGHVRDGRRLASRLGLDDALWFDHVEAAMLKLAEPEHADQAAYGYVRGTEVVQYVQDIRDRYGAYVEHFRGLDGT